MPVEYSALADVVHVRAKSIWWKGRRGCSCVPATTLKCSSAAVAIAVRSTVSAAARRRRGIKPSVPLANATTDYRVVHAGASARLLSRPKKMKFSVPEG
jgi:hypothetical protein